MMISAMHVSVCTSDYQRTGGVDRPQQHYGETGEGEPLLLPGAIRGRWCLHMRCRAHLMRYTV